MRRALAIASSLLGRFVGVCFLLVLGQVVSPVFLLKLGGALVGFGAFLSAAALLSGDTLRRSLPLFVFFAVYVPAGLACVYVPLRSVSLLLETQFPHWVGIVAEVPEGQLPLVDSSDRLAALVALGLVGVFTYRERRWLELQLRQLQNLPTSKPASVALGLVEVTGRASSAGNPIRDEVLMTARDPRPFYVEDDRGRILVDPRRPKDDSISLARFLGLELDAVSLSNGELRAGDQVYVVGTASRGGTDDPEAIVVHPRRVRQRRTGYWTSLLDEVGEWFTGASKSSDDYLDAFFISDSGESAARKAVQRGRRHVLAIGLTAIALSSWTVVTRHFRLRPPEIAFEEAVFSQPGFPGSVVETLVFLRHPHPDYRIAGARRLKETRPDVLDPRTAKELLNSTIPEAREIAARCLGSVSFGPSDRGAFDRVAGAFENNGPETQALLLRSAGSLGFAPSEAAPLITSGIASEVFTVRAAALQASAVLAVPELAPALASTLHWWSETKARSEWNEHQDLIEQAEETLLKLGPAATAPLNRLLSSDDGTAEHASELLVRGSADPNEFQSRIARLLDDHRAPIRCGALRGFAKHPLATNESTRPRLVELIRRHLHDEDGRTVDAALEALEKTGADFLYERDVHILLSFLGGSSDRRLHAVQLLAGAPVEGQIVADALIEHYQSSTDRYLRAFVLENVTGFTTDLTRLEPLLIESLASPDSLESLAASSAAAKLERGSPELLRGLSEAAHVLESGYRFVNVDVLGGWREWEALLELYRTNGYDPVRRAALDEILEGVAFDPTAIPTAVAALESATLIDAQRLLRAIAASGSESKPYFEQVHGYLRSLEFKGGSGSFYADVLSAIEAPPKSARAPSPVYHEASGTLTEPIPLEDGYTLTVWARSSDTRNERILECDLLTLWGGNHGLTIVFRLDPVPAESRLQKRVMLSRVLDDGNWHRIDVSHDASSRTLQVFVNGERRENLPSYEYGGLALQPEGGEDVVVRSTPTELTFVELGPSESHRDLVILDGPTR